MTRNTTTHRRAAAAAAFTLTEIMIALAMTALLLVGISKIFAITSSTISTGQAAAKAMRSQRAIQQTLSNDFLGSGPDIGGATYEAGMLPLVNTVDADYAAPFLTVSNFRVATYKNAADMASDTVAPPDTTTMNVTQFRARSLNIRGIDVDKNGSENTTSILTSGGETIPLYAYGDRNFRTDTLGFFTRGRFVSQTGSDGSAQSGLTSNEAFVWYGHLRVFNSTGSRLDITNAYGCPGEWLTPDSTAIPAVQPTGPLPNVNNRFADQFRLGRFQSLLAPAIIGNGRVYVPSQNETQNDNAVNAAGVFVGNDPTRPVRFVQRQWWSPDYIGSSVRPSMTPFDIDPTATLGSSVQIWVNGMSRGVHSDDRLEGATPAPNADAPILSGATGRTDVIGVDTKRARQRVKFVEDRDITVPLTTGSQKYWWESVPANWRDRYWVNPFPRTSQFADLSASNTDANETKQFNSKSLAQRQQLLADSCSQFIVEFAGDFVTQDDATGTPIIPAGGTSAGVPDGILDFVVVNNVRQTRWYGMPRDVDGNGSIPSYLNGNRINSPDVIPVSDFASLAAASLRRNINGAALAKPVARETGPTPPADTDDSYAAKLGPSTVYTFERTLPPLPASTTSYDFMAAVAEPTGSQDPGGTSYVCVWGPREFEHGTTLTAADGSTRTVYAVPQLIRILTDVRDPDGKMKEPLTQEYVFPVRVTGAVKPPTTPN